jgi:hypothetical protein
MKHTKILSFDSMYMLFPFRKLYLRLIKNKTNEENYKNNRLILYRLDKDNVFLTKKNNISGQTLGITNDSIDSMSIKFYQYIEKSINYKTLSINTIPLYQLYPRQVKLKLDGVLRGALRIRNLSNKSVDNLEVITDRQTALIMKEAFSFLNYQPKNIIWKVNRLLTLCITINSFIMRFFAILNMYISPSKLPSEYFYKHVNANAPTVLITTPKNRPADFFSMYVKEFNNQFNIVLYSLGVLDVTPINFKRIEFKKKKRVLRGIFNVRNLMWTYESYITDILLIYKNHTDLSMGIDVVKSVFNNKIDAHISRLQTNPVDTYLAIEARKRGIFILGDIEEEIFYCDSAVCPSRSENTESVRLAVAKGGKISYKGSNSMINYRFENFHHKHDNYLHKLLEVDTKKRIVFYASTPSKEESQRYLTEKFLIDYFSSFQELVLVMKTHPQDNGKITSQAYFDSSRPSNVILIGDIKQANKIASQKFNLFESFSFNAALASSDGFLTMSSSAILQALMLGVKTGLVDMFGNAYYDYLINLNATMLINNEDSLKSFIENKKLNISDDLLSYCGLRNNNKEFDLGMHLLHELNHKNHNKKLIETNIG